MIIVMARTTIIYLLIIAAMRLMGKRQLGELQPSELVTTILISNLASLPLEDPNLPFVTSLVPILLIVAYEILCASMQLKSPGFSKLVSGSAKVVVQDGDIRQGVLNELRYSAGDLMEALRAKDVFDLREVGFAVVETNGSVSVYKKQGDDALTPAISVVTDGQLKKPALDAAGTNEQQVLREIQKRGVLLSDVLLMQWADGGVSCFVRKEVTA